MRTYFDGRNTNFYAYLRQFAYWNTCLDTTNLDAWVETTRRILNPNSDSILHPIIYNPLEDPNSFRTFDSGNQTVTNMTFDPALDEGEYIVQLAPGSDTGAPTRLLGFPVLTSLGKIYSTSSKPQSPFSNTNTYLIRTPFSAKTVKHILSYYLRYHCSIRR